MLKRFTFTTLFIAVVLASSSSLYAAQPNPYLMPNETWISISGTAVETTPNAFMLDFGNGVVTVEMDGWKWYKDDYSIIEGDKVVVYGMIDDDLYETTTIEASSVFDETLGKYFYASVKDENYSEDYDYWFNAGTIIVGETTVRGTVTAVNGREFTIDQGTKEVIVDTSLLPYNPLDDKGMIKIDKGDYVSVNGKMQDDFWNRHELMADSVVMLVND